eukprot:s8150_g1.t1
MVVRLSLLEATSVREAFKLVFVLSACRAVVMVSPVSEAMKEEDLAAIFSVYGRVKRVDIERAEQKAMVQFALAEHATAAAATLPGTQAFAPGMRIRFGQVHGWSYAEDAAAAWGHVQVPWEWHAAHAEGLAASTMTSAPDSFHGSGLASDRGWRERSVGVGGACKCH